jgi:hypothetical protein
MASGRSREKTTDGDATATRARGLSAMTSAFACGAVREKLVTRITSLYLFVLAR